MPLYRTRPVLRHLSDVRLRGGISVCAFADSGHSDGLVLSAACVS